MKKLIFLFITFQIGFALSADCSYGTQQNLVSNKLLTVAHFFEPLDPRSPRNSLWPDHLTLEEVTSVSPDNFAKTLKRKWRVVYECEGKPVTTQFLMETLNGPSRWGHGLIEVVYDDKNRIQYVTNTTYGEDGKTVIPASDSGPFYVTDTSHYAVKALGSGSFQIDIPRYQSDIYHFALIDETGEFVIQVEIGQIPCGSGSMLKGLLVPIDDLVG